jgi:acetyl esterase/lipase
MMTVAALVLALVVLAVAPWAQIAAPTRTLLPLSVGAPELTAWLLLGALVALALSLLALRGSRTHRGRARVSLVLSLAAAAFPSYVLAQFPAALRDFTAQWTGTLRTTPADVAPIDARFPLRPVPFTWREMLAGLDLVPVRITRDIPMSLRDDVALTVDVYQPAGDHIAPVVVQIYGGAWRSGSPGDDATMAQALAGAGFAVFAIDYRHTPRWQWPMQLHDVLGALAWVRAHAAEYQADGARLALIGRSAGGQLAMRASQDERAGPVRAVVTVYGPVDLVEGYRSPPDPDPLDVRAVEEALFGGTPEERRDLYVDASPITRATRPHPPVLVITGGRDHIVEPRFGVMLHEALRASGVSLLLHLPWADHAFDAVPFGPSSQIALYYTQRFLAHTLR